MKINYLRKFWKYWQADSTTTTANFQKKKFLVFVVSKAVMSGYQIY